MVKSKYTFEKRQREIARQKKQVEKAARRAEAKKEQVNQEQGPLDEDQVPSGIAPDPNP